MDKVSVVVGTRVDAQRAEPGKEPSVRDPSPSKSGRGLDYRKDYLLCAERRARRWRHHAIAPSSTPQPAISAHIAE